MGFRKIYTSANRNSENLSGVSQMYWWVKCSWWSLETVLFLWTCLLDPVLDFTRACFQWEFNSDVNFHLIYRWIGADGHFKSETLGTVNGDLNYTCQYSKRGGRRSHKHNYFLLWFSPVKGSLMKYKSALNTVQQIAFWCESHTRTVFQSFQFVDSNVCFLHVPFPLSLLR